MTRALALALAPLACVAVVVLGPTKRFERSALGRAHRALGDAAPRVATALVTIAVCDRKRGAAVASACFDALDRPNPLGQIVYLTLAIGGHASFVEGVEKRLLDGGDARGVDGGDERGVRVRVRDVGVGVLQRARNHHEREQRRVFEGVRVR